MYLSRLAGGASGSSGSGPGSPLPARLGLASPRNAGGASSTSKSPSFSAARAGLDGGGALAVPGRSPLSLPAPTLSMAPTGNLRRLASVAEFRSACKSSLAGGADPQQLPALLRGASVGGAAGAAAAQLQQQQQQLQQQQQGLGRAALRRYNNLVQEEQEAAAAAASTTSGSGRGGGSGPFTAPPPPHPGCYHTIGPGSTLGQRAAGTAAAISRVRKLAGAAMSREGSFLTALSLLGGEDAAANAAAGGRDQYHHPQLPYASPPTAGSLGLGTPPLPFRSSSVGSNDTHHSGSGGGGGGGFDPSSPPGMPLLSTSPAPATVIMGPGARAPMGMSASSALASGGGAGPGGAVGSAVGHGGGGGRYAASGNAVGGGGVGGGRGGWGEPRNRAMAGLIADAREITELCR